MAPALFALVAAELAARLVTPAQTTIRPLPVDPEAYFTREQIERGRRFVRPQMAIGLARSAIELGAMAALARSSRRRPLARSPVLDGALRAATITGVLTAAQLPLGALARRRAIDVGLVTQPWRGWAVDVAKSTAIETTLAAAGGGAVVELTRRYPRRWWILAAVGAFTVGTVFGALAPVVLAPLFNDFTPLPEGEARADVLELAAAAGVDVGEVYSMDASRRSTVTNAYVTGLGPTKRVVLYDTLLSSYSREEVRVVVAHELAHVANRDILRGVVYGGLVAPAGAFAVQRMSWALSNERGTGEALPALALAAALVLGPTGLIVNRVSRAIERRADEFALELSEAPDAFVSFEQRIAVRDLADVEPPWLVRRVLATHPTTVERIGAALAYSER